ncbi:MAG TPA: hypothetical protein VGO29_03775, partial [Solirubrobacteraceae bacterium]|nr:hypothetical protein [Solirubrobacteraceae bacterium]
MRRRPIPALLGACALTLASAAAMQSAGAGAALAAGQSQSPLDDQGSSPNYRSLITSVSPAVPGLSVQVLQ